MAYATWLADALRAQGLRVHEEGGWTSRGHGQLSAIRGVMLHHTAGAATGNFPSLGVVRDGTGSLAGPLANLGLARDGTWFVIAAGLAYHAGAGGPWRDVAANAGNQHLLGIEAESVGTRNDWTEAQLDSYPRGVAALLAHLRMGADRVVAHKEWAPTRKIDPAHWPGDIPGFRDSVARILEGDTVNWSQTWTNPVTGTTEPASVTLRYMEDRIVKRLSGAIANAGLDSTVSNPVVNTTEKARTAIGYAEQRIINGVVRSVASLLDGQQTEPATPEAIANALAPLITSAVTDALGQDNEEQANAIVEALARRLAE
ncbi:N-acetylmuramoyl-L-alanine amidase [Actinoalloteichus caeruleus]|uniref:N-acetylmuramoyl-L-alanine amidase n=1 Tax=Actinoalloteichus caeruleus DSM 43889 TaxID=1120930 RepID=A0ABT1JH07_ACTCY|nr:N-acetylmuramoyl-L-alanine amidase [Actinoalloteichus caeruleus]MCP2331453.1 N-acetylmuramoyl-L-alanine amidase [Actinoalloteichus caeruleus DSM 43889]